MKHTPGPWELKSDPCHYDTLSSIEAGCTIIGRRGRPRREMMVEVGGHSSVEAQEANARLIAAAPDLLQALEEADKVIGEKYGSPELHPGADPNIGPYETYGDAKKHHSVWVAMRKAINKAKGIK